MTDTIGTVVNLLKAEWLAGNTDSLTPAITPIYEKKRVGGLGGEKTWIGVYLPAAAEEEVNDLGYNTVNRKEFATIDIRTSESYAHAIKVRDEADRILKANRKTTTGFPLVVVKRLKDLSDATRNLWRWIIEIELQVYAEAVV